MAIGHYYHQPGYMDFLKLEKERIEPFSSRPSVDKWIQPNGIEDEFDEFLMNQQAISIRVSKS